MTTRLTDAASKKRIYVRARPTISASGTRYVQTGKSRWKLAPDWPAVVVEDGQLAYVLAGNQVHVLVERGEVMGLGESLLDMIRAKFFSTNQ